MQPVIQVSDNLAFSFLKGAPLAIVAVDAQGKLAFVNQQATQLFGYSEQELIGSPVEVLIPKSYHAQHQELLQAYYQQPHARVMGVGREVRAIDRQGREFPVEIGLTPIQTSDGMFVVAAVADITIRKHLEREVTAAKLVQEAMLPQSFPQTSGCQIGGATRFADAAGGDFLDCVILRDGEATLMIGDASGHGFAAALVSVAAKSYLRALSRLHQDPGELLTHVNQLLLEDLAEGRFVTLFVGQLNASLGRFRYAGAGHAGYILSRQGELKNQLVSTGPPLGWLHDANYTVAEAAVVPGDCILLMTDGIEESFGEGDEAFGRERIFQTLAHNSEREASVQAQAILDAVGSFTNGKQNDDMTVLVTRMT
jgi:PAS domain S-box-containing protein